MKKNILLGISGIIAGILFIAMISTTNVYAQSSEQIEKQDICWDYKGIDMTDSKRIMVNCAEFVFSDYDDIKEFIAEEHPELVITTK